MNISKHISWIYGSWTSLYLGNGYIADVYLFLMNICLHTAYSSITNWWIYICNEYITDEYLFTFAMNTPQLNISLSTQLHSPNWSPDGILWVGKYSRWSRPAVPFASPEVSIPEFFLQVLLLFIYYYSLFCIIILHRIIINLHLFN